MNKKKIEYELNKEIEQAAKYNIAGDCTMYETEGQYEAYIDGLNFALSSISQKSVVEKSDILTEIRDCLDKWELQVSEIGNECAYTDRFLDKLPSLVEKLTAISTQATQEASHIKYGIVLKEREFTSGLTRNDSMFLFNKIGDAEAYPIEMEARVHECSAMGFISREAAEIFDYDYENSGLHDFISLILDDMDNESENCEYEFRGVRIWLSR